MVLEHINLFVIVEKKCYVLDLAQSPKTWETFPELPQGCAYPAMVYNEKLNRLYVVSCETNRADTAPWVYKIFSRIFEIYLFIMIDFVDDTSTVILLMS